MEVNVVKTSSCTKVEVVKVSHTWTICNFSYCDQSNGHALKSETFSSGAEDKVIWCLELYPRGSTSQIKDYVSIFLRLVSCDKPEIKTKGRIALYNDKMEEFHSMPFDYVFPEGGDWGYQNYVRKDFLLDHINGLLPDDKLTVFGEVSFATATVNVPKKVFPPKLNDPVSTLCENLELLLDTQKFSDVLVIAGGREFRAHKTILAARSAVFSAMFEHEMEEHKHNRVDIIDMDDNVVEEMLRFIYTGKVSNIENIADTLLVAADKYVLDSLKLMCQGALCESLAVENVVRILVLADSHDCDWLKTQAISFIKEHMSAVMDTEDLKFAETSHPYLIAEILRASVIKSNGDADKSMPTTTNQEASQSHI